MSQVLESIKVKIEAIEAQKKAMVEELRTEFPKLFEELFAKSKLIDSFGWTQYTPYFNDGDTCEFGVHADDPYVNDVDTYGIDWYSWKVKHDHYQSELMNDESINIEESKIVDEFIKVINAIPEEFLQSLFGDHAKVTVYRNGSVDVEEYDHD